MPDLVLDPGVSAVPRFEQRELARAGVGRDGLVAPLGIRAIPSRTWAVIVNPPEYSTA